MKYEILRMFLIVASIFEMKSVRETFNGKIILFNVKFNEEKVQITERKFHRLFIQGYRCKLVMIEKSHRPSSQHPENV